MRINPKIIKIPMIKNSICTLSFYHFFKIEFFNLTLGLFWYNLGLIMCPEAEKPKQQPEKPTKSRKPIDVFAANRRFERFMMSIDPGFRLDALRPDQKGSYSPHEAEQFRRESEQPLINPEEGEVIATVRYDFENKEVIIQRKREPPVKV
jgi:hypothetical protein